MVFFFISSRVFGNRKLMIIDFYIYIEEEENFAVAIIIFESGCMILSNVVVNVYMMILDYYNYYYTNN